MLGLTELLLVLSAGTVWAVFELRSVRPKKRRDDAVPPPSETNAPPSQS